MTPPANAGRKADVEKAAERERDLRAQQLIDAAFVMSSAGGRRFVNRILNETDMFGEVFNPNGSITNLNLGKRKIGLFVYRELEEACPESILLMRQEYLKENSDG